VALRLVPTNPLLVAGVFCYEGVTRTPLDTGLATQGDIILLAGVPEGIKVGDTVTHAANPVAQPIDTPPLAPPTLSMDFGANDGPLGGREGKHLTSSKIRERLQFETDNNVTIQIGLSDTDAEKTVVFARGELQLGILIEQMRREGYEMCVSPPKIVFQECAETGDVLEPFEEVRARASVFWSRDRLATRAAKTHRLFTPNPVHSRRSSSTLIRSTRASSWTS